MGGEEGGGAYSRNPTIALDVKDEGARGKEDFFFFFLTKFSSLFLSPLSSTNKSSLSFILSLSIYF